MSTRIGYLDAAKGIGILFVVLGHNHIKLEYPLVYQVVYSFHMPFFFLLSGMFFKAEGGFLDLVRRRFNSLLRPFIAYMVIIYSGSIFFSKVDLPTIFGRILKAFYAGPNTLEWVPLWFLPHLFLVNLCAFLLARFVYERLPHVWLRALFLAILLGAGVAAIRLFWPVTFSFAGREFEFYGLPWSADLLPVTIAFFLLGYELRRSFFDNPNVSRYSGWVFAAALILFAGLHAVFSYTIDFYIRSYGASANSGAPAGILGLVAPVVVTLEAIAGSLLILGLARGLEKGPSPGQFAGTSWLFSVLKYLGAASVVILIFHFVPQDFLDTKLMGMRAGVLAASALSFVAGVLFPLALFALVVRPNPLLSAWFGLPRERKD